MLYICTILSDSCNSWIHIPCNTFDCKDYYLHQKNMDLEFECIKCRSEYTTFTHLDGNQFDIAVKKGVNYLTDLQTRLTLGQQTILNKIQVSVHNTQNSEVDEGSDIDDVDINPVTYSIDDFIKLKPDSNKHAMRGPSDRGNIKIIKQII